MSFREPPLDPPAVRTVCVVCDASTGYDGDPFCATGECEDIYGAASELDSRLILGLRASSSCRY